MLREGCTDTVTPPDATSAEPSPDTNVADLPDDDPDFDDNDVTDGDVTEGPLRVDLTDAPVGRTNLPALPLRRSRGIAIGWLALAAAVVLLLGGAWVGQARIVETWPAATRLYAAIGLSPPAVGEGLVMRGVTVSRTVEAETQQLMITGLIANVGDSVVDVPWLRASLHDADGREVHAWTFRPETGRLLPGETVDFASSTPAAEGQRGGAIVFVAAP